MTSAPSTPTTVAFRTIDLRGRALSPGELKNALPRAAANASSSESAVQAIIDDVRARGLEALRDFALRFDGEELTYAELQARAHALAERLAARGVGPESVVALALPRGADLVTALLGVLHAGAAYLPLDLSWPRRRIDDVLDSVRLSDLMHDEMVVRARVGLGPKAPTQLAAAHERRQRNAPVAVDRRLPVLQD